MSLRGHFEQLWHPDDVLDSLWSVCASPYTRMMILIILAVLVSLAALLPQKPLSASAGATGNAAWLSSLRDRYGRNADWLQSIGLLDIAGSLWLRGLLGLLAFNAMLGAVDLVRPRLRPDGLGLESSTFTGEAARLETGETLANRVLGVLRSARYRVLGDRSGVSLYADRFALFPLLVCCGLLLSIAGLAVSERTAWWEGGLSLRPAQVRAVGHGTGWAIRAEVIQPGAEEATTDPVDHRVRLTLLQQDRVIASRILGRGVPLYYGGLLFYATDTEQALLVQAGDKAGRALSMRTPETGAAQFTEVSLRFSKQESSRYIVMLTPGAAPGRYFQQSANERYILVPDRNLTLRLSYSAAGGGSALPLFQVEAFRSAERSPFFVEQLRGAGSIEIAGDIYLLTPRQYAVIKMGQDYGALIVFAGAAIVLLGLALSAWRPMQRIWLTARPSAGQPALEIVAAPGPGIASCRPFGNLMQQLAGLLETQQETQPAQGHPPLTGDP